MSISTLKIFCEKLSIPSDSLLFGVPEKIDVTYLAERLERLPPEQFAAVKEFLNQIFALFARLNP